MLEIIGSDYLIPYLMRNAEFRERYAAALRRMETEVFSPERVDAFIADYREKYLSELELSVERYYGEDAVSEVSEDIDNIQHFFDNRPEYMEAFIKEHLENWE